MLAPLLLALAAVAAPAGDDGTDGRFATEETRREQLGQEALTALHAAGDWLASHRTGGGAWAAAGDDGEPEVIPSSLALLALLADGSTTHRGPHADAVAEASTWVVARAVDEPSARGKGIALLALAELHRLEPRAVEATALEELVARLARQEMAGGGFPAYDETRPDAITTAWVVAGLCEARRAGLTLPGSSLDEALSWLAGQVGEGGEVRLETNAGALAHGAALFLLPRLLAGERVHEAPGLLEQSERILRPDTRPEIEQEDLEFWYAAATSLVLLERPEAWSPGHPAEQRLELAERGRSFRSLLLRMLLAEQLRDGSAAGSWQGFGWAPEAGPVRSTALAALALAAPLRVPPSVRSSDD